jgi:ATP-dependent Clp protease ATP-binding subunit ClpC
MDLPPLSPSAQVLMSSAAAECGRRQHYYIGVEHLFTTLGKQGKTSLAPSLALQGVDMARFGDELLEAATIHAQRPWGDEILITPRIQEVLRLAGWIAARGGSAWVEEIHILEAILQEAHSTPLRRLRAAGINVAELHHAILAPATSPETSSTPTLDKFGRDLTARARAGTLTPVIARESELEQLAHVLLRKNKNNPVLVGEAGVGKTAVVEGFALRLISEDCPAPLKGRRLIEVSLPALVAGTRYRGDFEDRLVAVLREATSVPGLILFLDEIHTLMGAGASEGALDAASILKPSLARGEIRCVGATTLDEYRRWIEQDAALERRFEKILVEEPAPDQGRRMLEGAAATLSAYHRVEIAPEAVAAALELTVRYVPQRRLPDKAIDALDQSCARVLLNALASAGDSTGALPLVRDADIARTVAQWTGIPVERISGEEARRLLQVEEELRRRVIGQDHAVAAVSRAVVTARAGLADPRRPTGVFLFLGPTGVGKTELARGLAEVVFGDEKRLLRFDMSEFTEPHSVAGLLGAPPGYVGYEKEGRLVSAVRTAPHSVVLFDEVEKAHPKIYDLFLQIFDEGQLKSAAGAPADFRNSIVILTSNLDPHPVAEKQVGFAEKPEPTAGLDSRTVLTSYFRPELLNRIDEVILFKPLALRGLRVILQRLLGEIEKLASQRGIHLVLDDSAQEWLIAQSAPERFGARELRRVLDRCLRQPLAREILERGELAGSLHVTVADGALRFS